MTNAANFYAGVAHLLAAWPAWWEAVASSCWDLIPLSERRFHRPALQSPRAAPGGHDWAWVGLLRKYVCVKCCTSSRRPHRRCCRALDQEMDLVIRRSHPTHRLLLFGGHDSRQVAILFCSKCGCYTQSNVRMLADRCRRMPHRGNGSSTSTRLRRMLAGWHPRHDVHVGTPRRVGVPPVGTGSAVCPAEVSGLGASVGEVIGGFPLVVWSAVH